MTGSYRIAGVGGQGVITMGKAISTILMMEKLDPVAILIPDPTDMDAPMSSIISAVE